MTHRKTLVFHIGDHKTGSTSIQTAFAQGRVTLEGRSVFYSARVSHNSLKQHCKAYARPKPSPARNRAINKFRQLASRIRQADTDFCLISAEAFETIPPAVFHDIVTSYFSDAADRIHVVAYVRPHAARLLSSFSERIKIGVPTVLSGSLESFHQKMHGTRRLHYHDRFHALRTLFGDQFTLRPMIRSQLHGGSVVDDFVHYGFDQTPFRIAGASAANETLDLQDLMRLKVLQSRLADCQSPRLRHALGWEFRRVLSTLAPPKHRTRLRLHKTLAQTVHDTYLADAKAMDAEFFDRQPLLENELNTTLQEAVETPQSTNPADYLSDADMRSLNILSEVMAGMFEHENGEWPAFLRDKYMRSVQKEAQDRAQDRTQDRTQDGAQTGAL